jgi:hypothetical protein
MTQIILFYFKDKLVKLRNTSNLCHSFILKREKKSMHWYD